MLQDADVFGRSSRIDRPEASGCRINEDKLTGMLPVGSGKQIDEGKPCRRIQGKKRTLECADHGASRQYLRGNIDRKILT